MPLKPLDLVVINEDAMADLLGKEPRSADLKIARLKGYGLTSIQA